MRGVNYTHYVVVHSENSCCLWMLIATLIDWVTLSAQKLNCFITSVLSVHLCHLFHVSVPSLSFSLWIPPIIPLSLSSLLHSLCPLFPPLPVLFLPSSSSLLPCCAAALLSPPSLPRLSFSPLSFTPVPLGTLSHPLSRTMLSRVDSGHLSWRLARVKVTSVTAPGSGYWQLSLGCVVAREGIRECGRVIRVA